MKLPKYILRVAGSDFVVANKEHIEKLISIMSEAIPVHVDHRANPMEIELSHFDDPLMTRYYQEVTIVRIPPNVVWKRKAQSGEVEIVRPVEKAPKALPPPKAKALPGRKVIALPAPDPQQPLALGS